MLLGVCFLFVLALSLTNFTVTKWQHAHNPVNWHPWGEEAFAAAKRENKPILLSIGYSACHWCHVMEHESFENEEIAKLMNDNFVNIKVDREERPDLDQIYMNAVQMMTHHGGWPMTVFLTPEGVPYYGGTYFPPVDRHNMPGFPRVLIALAEAWVPPNVGGLVAGTPPMKLGGVTSQMAALPLPRARKVSIWKSGNTFGSPVFDRNVLNPTSSPLSPGRASSTNRKPNGIARV